MKHGLPVLSWLANLSVAAKLQLITALMAIIIAVQLVVLWNGLLILSTLRAYVGGEGLWSKSEKEAVLNLHHYADTGKEADYKKFLACLEVPGGDKAARIELDKPNPDYAKVYLGFIQGENDPADVKDAATFYRRYRHTSYLKRAIAIWREGDARLSDLLKLGSRLHALVTAGKGRSRRTRTILNQVDALNDKLTVLEDNFSSTLGEASRWAYKVLLLASLCVAVVVGCIGVGVANRIGWRISKGIEEINAGALRVAGGDYDQALPIRWRDELGLLARSFNTMTRSLSQSRTELKAMIDAVPDLMLRIRVDGLVLDAKPAKGFPFPYSFGKSGRKENRGNPSTRNERLISNLLNASSIEEGTIAFRKHKVDIGTIVAEAVSQYLPIIRRKGLWIDFARPASPLMGLADPQKGLEIVKTVLDNAVKFTASGGIEIATHEDDHFVYVAVKDTGPGIPLDIQAKLFTRELAFTGPHPERGFGLGLFIAKKLMEMQQGEISVSSSPGEGSRIVLKFQRSERNPARLETGESERFGEPATAVATACTAIQEGDEPHG